MYKESRVFMPCICMECEVDEGGGARLHGSSGAIYLDNAHIHLKGSDK